MFIKAKREEANFCPANCSYQREDVIFRSARRDARKPLECWLGNFMFIEAKREEAYIQYATSALTKRNMKFGGA